MRRFRFLGATVGLAAAASLSLPGVSASAQVGGNAGVDVRQPMYLAMADGASSPGADGRVQVHLTNGATVSLTASEADLVLHPRPQLSSSGVAQPNGIVFGDCGYSTVNVGYKSNGAPVRMTTGFHVNDSATGYQWGAYTTGPSYSYHYTASGNLALRHDWNGSHNSSANYPSGWYTSTVSPSESFAILWWGGVCYSGGPTSTAYL